MKPCEDDQENNNNVPLAVQLFLGRKLGKLSTEFAVLEQKFSNLRLMILAGLAIIEGTVFFILKLPH